MPVHMDVSKKAINRVLGEALTKRSHLNLVVHAHWAKHEIEDVEQDDAYRDSFFLVCATFTKQLDNTETINESGCCVHRFLKVFGCIFCLYISRFCVILFHRQCLSDVINGFDTLIIHQTKCIVFILSG